MTTPTPPAVVISPPVTDTRPEPPPILDLWVVRYQHWYTECRDPYWMNLVFGPFDAEDKARKWAEEQTTWGDRNCQPILIPGAIPHERVPNRDGIVQHMQ